LQELFCKNIHLSPSKSVVFLEHLRLGKFDLLRDLEDKNLIWGSFELILYCWFLRILAFSLELLKPNNLSEHCFSLEWNFFPANYEFFHVQIVELWELLNGELVPLEKVSDFYFYRLELQFFYYRYNWNWGGHLCWFVFCVVVGVE